MGVPLRAQLVLSDDWVGYILAGLGWGNLQELEERTTCNLQSFCLEEGKRHPACLLGRVFLPEERGYQLERNKHGGVGADGAHPSILCFEWSHHMLYGIGIQQGNVTVKGLGRFNMRRHSQLLWVEWNSNNICSINISFKTKVHSMVRVSTPYVTGVPFDPVEQFQSSCH
jgi:hypothetical protein